MRYYILAALVLLIINTYLPSCDEEYYIDPILNTIPAADSNITSTGVTLYGEVTYVGNRKIVMYGIELYKNSITNPVGVAGFDTVPGVGVYAVEFTGLEPNTFYYYRAFAQINTAYVYSQNVEDFTTKPAK